MLEQILFIDKHLFMGFESPAHPLPGTKAAFFIDTSHLPSATSNDKLWMFFLLCHFTSLTTFLEIPSFALWWTFLFSFQFHWLPFSVALKVLLRILSSITSSLPEALSLGKSIHFCHSSYFLHPQVWVAIFFFTYICYLPQDFLRLNT